MNSKRKQAFTLEKINIKESDDKRIIDYADKNFELFWETTSKEILNKVENKVIKKMLPKRSDWFIDIGCGFGRNVEVCLDNEQKMVLVDYSIQHLQTASKKYKDEKNIFYIAADAYKLPFRCEIFDYGISIRLFHHINKPEDFFKGLVKIFKKNANIVITYVNKRNFFRILKYGLKCFKHNHIELSKMIYGSHPIFFKKLVKKYGLSIKKNQGTGFIHQLSHAFGRIEKFVEKNKRFLKIFIKIEMFFDFILGKLKLSLIQFVLLKKDTDPEINSSDRFISDKIEDIIKCPNCESIKLIKEKKNYNCLNCNKQYPILNNIIDFRLK